MSRLSLAFLGRPEVRHAECLLKFPTRKTLALLVYLAVEGGFHTREKLTALFWPESNGPQGRAVLRNTLRYLRSALLEVADMPAEKTAGESPHPPHLLVEYDAIGFASHADIELDLHDVEAAVRALQMKGLERHELIAQLQAAVALYRGNFLEGFSLSDASSFDDWVSIQREYCQRQVNTAFDQLSRLQSEGGEIRAALDTATRWLAHFPLQEDACQQVMSLHFQAGDRTAALRVYETYRTMLAKELEMQPGPEMVALAERIRSTFPSRHLLQPALRAPSSPPSVPALREGPFVGRVDEYMQLTGIYALVERHQPRVVILEGEAGIGKTRLALEFLRQAETQGADILQGRAFETGGRLPYQVLVEALRARIAHENAPDDLLSDVWLTELSRLLPELHDRYPDLPLPPQGEAEARISLFEAVAQLTQALAARSPLVLFLDDFQWADASSLDLLRYVSRSWVESAAPVLLLLSICSETSVQNEEAQSALLEWLTGLEQDIPVVRVGLGNLSAEESLRLVQALAQEEARQGLIPLIPLIPLLSQSREQGMERTVIESGIERFTRWLFDQTHGQPLFMVETLKSLLERGLLVPQPDKNGGWSIDFAAILDNEQALRGFLPSRIREMISLRLARLSVPATEFLIAASILCYDCTFEYLSQIASLGENEGLRALAEVMQSRLLVETAHMGRGSGGATYGFAHHKIREVVYVEAGDARRRIFHKRALDALRALSVPAGILAYHAQAAGLMNAAFHYLLIAADDAMRLFAICDAITIYEQAQQFMYEYSGEDDGQTGQTKILLSEQRHLYVQLGRAYELNSELEKASATYSEMLSCARAHSAPEMECAALNRLATVTAHDMGNAGNVAKAAEFLSQALQIAESNHDMAGLAETEWNMALMHLYSFDWEATYACGERALAHARSFELPELTALSLNVIAHAEMGLGAWNQAEAHAGEARALFSRLSNRAMEIDCLCLVANAHLHRGQIQPGISTAQTAYELSLKIANAWGQVLSVVYLTQGLLEVGAYTEALEFAQKGVSTSCSLRFTPLRILSLTMLGNVQQALFQLEPARTAYLEALSLSEGLDLRLYSEAILSVLCMNYALGGNWAEAHACALRALATRDYVVMLPTGITRWYETEALLRGGSDEEACEDVQLFGERVKEYTRFRLPYLRAVAVVACWQSEPHVALSCLDEAAALAEELGLPGEAWQIAAALGELHQSQGDQSEAQSAFRRAARIVQELAGNIRDEARRVTFLEASQVQRVVERGSPEARRPESER